MFKHLTIAEQITLGLVAEAPRHGYAIEQLIQERGIRNWSDLGFSSIYYILNKLQANGLLRAQSVKERKQYEITEKGHKLLQSATLDSLISLQASHSPVLVGIANSHILDTSLVLESLKQRKETITQQIKDIQVINRAKQPTPGFVQAIFDYSTTQLRSEAEWCEATITKLKEDTMDKIDFKKTLANLYAPKNKDWQEITVPKMHFLMIDGQGDPNNDKSYGDAVEALFSVSYAVKFMSKRNLGKDYGVSALEGLWYAEDYSVFTASDKSQFHWTMMIMQPEWITQTMVEEAIAARKAKRELPALPKLRFEAYEEGLALQLMHIGSYDDEAPKLAHLHDELMLERKLTFNGHHHEIYIGDPRKTAPEKLKTILRQPVKAA